MIGMSLSFSLSLSLPVVETNGLDTPQRGYDQKLLEPRE